MLWHDAVRELPLRAPLGRVTLANAEAAGGGSLSSSVLPNITAHRYTERESVDVLFAGGLCTDNVALSRRGQQSRVGYGRTIHKVTDVPFGPSAAQCIARNGDAIAKFAVSPARQQRAASGILALPAGSTVAALPRVGSNLKRISSRRAAVAETGQGFRPSSYRNSRT